MTQGLTGLLGGFDDPKTLGLLGMAAPLLQAGGWSQTPVSLGQAMGAGLQGGVQAYAQGRQSQQLGQMREMQLAEMQRAAKQREAQAAAFQRIVSPGMTPEMTGGPTRANAAALPNARFTPDQLAMLEAMGPEAGMQVLAQQTFRKPDPIKLGANEELRDPRDPSKVLARGVTPDKTFKVGDTRVIEMGDQKITQEWDGKTWQRYATAPRSTEPRTRMREVTLDDGVYLVNDDTKDKFYLGPRPNRNEGEGREFTQEKNIRAEYTTASKPFEELRQHWTRLNAAHNQKDGPGDIALVYSFMKMLDPTSVVRETEFATAETAGGVPERIWQLYNRVRAGERLPDEVRDGFLQQGARQFDGIARNQVEVEQRFRNLATANGLNPDRTVPDVFGRLPRPQMDQPFQWGGVQRQPTRTNAPARGTPARQPTRPATANVPALPPGFELVQ